MKFNLFFSVLFTALIFQSCSSGSNESKNNATTETKDSVAPKENFPKGQIIEQVVCKSDASQNYAMYLPSTYSAEKKYPVIYIFDAHGDGKLPVSKYKDLAEQYGFIIVGSNNSKNGTAWEESQSIANKLFEDTQNRLSVNSQRIYVLGFSGGARVANGLAITNGSISGVICCGASAPAASSGSPRSDYTFMGIAGTDDFNYTEMRKYDMVELAGRNVKHVLITFNGKHEWPPKDIMDEAFWWLELNEMRKNNSYKNDALVAQRLQPALKQIETFQQKGQVMDSYNLCRKTITFYDGLTDLTSCFALYQSYKTNPEIDKALKLEEVGMQKEEELKQNYLKALQTEDLNWWQKDIAGLNQKIKTEKDKDKVQMYKRTLGFLSLAMYMQASGALKQNAIPAAEFFCKLYVLVDPTNSEAYYLTASVNELKGNNKEAIDALNLAVKNGFSDTARLQNDSVFNGIKGMKEFENVVGGVKK